MLRPGFTPGTAAPPRVGCRCRPAAGATRLMTTWQLDRQRLAAVIAVAAPGVPSLTSILALSQALQGSAGLTILNRRGTLAAIPSPSGSRVGSLRGPRPAAICRHRALVDPGAGPVPADGTRGRRQPSCAAAGFRLARLGPVCVIDYSGRPPGADAPILPKPPDFTVAQRLCRAVSMALSSSRREQVAMTETSGVRVTRPLVADPRGFCERLAALGRF